MGNVVEVVASGETELADHVAGGRFDVAVVFVVGVVFWTAEIGV